MLSQDVTMVKAQRPTGLMDVKLLVFLLRKQWLASLSDLP